MAFRASPANEPSPGAIASPIPIDPGLLDLLPDELDGLARQTDPAVDAGIASDPDLARLARSFATALYVDASSGEFAYVSLVRLTAPLSEEAYRDYRDSFDEAACAQAGGRAGTAEGTVGSRPVHIGSCGGGLLTYHLELEEGAVIMSVSSLGTRRLGEKVIVALRQRASS